MDYFSICIILIIIFAFLLLLVTKRIFSLVLENEGLSRIVNYVVFIPFGALCTVFLILATEILEYGVLQYAGLNPDIAFWCSSYHNFILAIVAVILNALLVSSVIFKCLKKELKTKKTFILIVSLITIASFIGLIIHGLFIGDYTLLYDKSSYSSPTPRFNINTTP